MNLCNVFRYFITFYFVYIRAYMYILVYICAIIRVNNFECLHSKLFGFIDVELLGPIQFNN